MVTAQAEAFAVENSAKKGVHVGRTPHMHTFFAESLAQAEQLQNMNKRNYKGTNFFSGGSPELRTKDRTSYKVYHTLTADRAS